MRLVVADDSALLREGLVGLLERQEHTVVGQAANATELLAVVGHAAGAVDVVITDVRMPPISPTACGPLCRSGSGGRRRGILVVVRGPPVRPPVVRATRAGGAGGRRRSGLPAQGPDRPGRRLHALVGHRGGGRGGHRSGRGRPAGPPDAVPPRRAHPAGEREVLELMANAGCRTRRSGSVWCCRRGRSASTSRTCSPSWTSARTRRIARVGRSSF